MMAERWWSPWRSVDDTTILHVDLAPSRQREEQAVALLDEAERARWKRSLSGGTRYAFALCRAALRVNLAEHAVCDAEDLSFGHLDHGKPFAIIGGRRSGISFNVSHSGGHGLIAIGGDDVGVDVEERSLHRDFEGLASRVYGPRERQRLARVSGTARIHLFYRLWTMKEALLKAIGTGLSLSPSRFEVPETMLDSARACIFRFPHDPSPPLRLIDLGEERFAAALASRSGTRIP
ncbi:MAG: 4'-phosphopantetheinyl transferase superfamily protein [bacterium]|nr:4'-phosphopantetheinyl transferase superfamily protein [bacterium]